MCENISSLVAVKGNNQRCIQRFIFKDVFAALFINSLKLKTTLIFLKKQWVNKLCNIVMIRWCAIFLITFLKNISWC